MLLDKISKIKDEELRKELLDHFEEVNRIESELESAKETALRLKEDNEKLRVMNTDLYSRALSTLNNEEVKVEEIEPTFEEKVAELEEKLKAYRV